MVVQQASPLQRSMVVKMLYFGYIILYAVYFISGNMVIYPQIIKIHFQDYKVCIIYRVFWN